MKGLRPHHVCGYKAAVKKHCKKHEKGKMQNYGREIRRGKMKKEEKLEMTTVGQGIWQQN